MKIARRTHVRARLCVCKCGRFEKRHQLYIYRTYAHTVRAGEDWSRRRMKVCQNYTAAAPGPEKQNLRSALYFIIRTTCSAVVLSRRVHVCVRVKKKINLWKKKCSSTLPSLVLSSKHSPYSSTPKYIILLLLCPLWVLHDACSTRLCSQTWRGVTLITNFGDINRILFCTASIFTRHFGFVIS